MPMYCHRDGCETREFDDTEFMCPDHRVDLVPDPPPARVEDPSVPADPSPAPGSGRYWSTSTCWNCGAATPNPENTQCLACPEALVPPRLLLTWADGSVRLDPGESTDLGRVGPHAKLFGNYANVSRCHAIVGVDQNGDAWIEPRSLTNGTFRADRGEELTPEQRYPLRDGEALRFALDVPLTVAVFALPDR